MEQNDGSTIAMALEVFAKDIPLVSVCLESLG